MQLTLAVVEPQHVSLLGGGALLFKMRGRPARFLDFREEAPALYHPDTFCGVGDCALDGPGACACANASDQSGTKHLESPPGISRDCYPLCTDASA